MKSLRFLVVASLLTFAACNRANDPDNVGKPVVTEAVDYGNGVYYFPYEEAKFGNALSQFIKRHDELELVAITGDGNGSYGRDTGYFAVFRVVHR